MISFEPPRTAYDLNFSLAGFPVRVHPLFWLITLLLGARPDTKPADVLIWILAVFVSIVVHEMGHALAFRYYRQPCRIVLYSFGGLAIPDSPQHYYYGRSDADWEQSRWAQIAIALAGPAAGFVLAAAVTLAVYLSGHQLYYQGLVSWLQFELNSDGAEIRSQKLFILVQFMLHINIMWGLVNLLPVYPLDGGRVAREVLLHFNPMQGQSQAWMLSLGAAVGMAALSLLVWSEFYTALLFGYLAYLSYKAMEVERQGYGGDRRW